MRDEKGEEMHKSKGNAIWFDDAAEIAGVDVMRWLYLSVNPSHNLNFGFGALDEIRRQFILPLWNSYSFFVTYARLDGFDPTDSAPIAPPGTRSLLDRWIVSRLNQVIATVRDELDATNRTWQRRRSSGSSSKNCRTGTSVETDDGSGSRKPIRTRPPRTPLCYEVLTTLSQAARAVHAIPGRRDVPESGSVIRRRCCRCRCI